jgi:type VI protein secretion system component VasF
MPPPLHAELARAADRKQVSLNQFIIGSLSNAVRRRRSDEPLGGAEPVRAAAQQTTGRSSALLANLVALAVIAALAVVLLVIALSRL